MRTKAKTVLITGECSKCGRFDVVRKRGKRVSTNGQVYDLPKQVVCPRCGWHSTIIKVKDR